MAIKFIIFFVLFFCFFKKKNLPVLARHAAKLPPYTSGISSENDAWVKLERETASFPRLRSLLVLFWVCVHCLLVVCFYRVWFCFAFPIHPPYTAPSTPSSFSLSHTSQNDKRYFFFYKRWLGSVKLARVWVRLHRLACVANNIPVW